YWVLQEPNPPTLTTISTQGLADEHTAFNISEGSLLATSNAAAASGNPIQFRIMGVQNGTLTITHNGVATAISAPGILAGTTLVGPGDGPGDGTGDGTGDTLTWTGNL